MLLFFIIFRYRQFSCQSAKKIENYFFYKNPESINPQKIMINKHLILFGSKFFIGFIWPFLKHADDSIDFYKKFGREMIFWMAIK